jgi:hypothetical protein
VRVTRGGGRLQVEVIWKRPNPGLLSCRPDGTSIGLARRESARLTKPLQGRCRGDGQPRVARSSQPWAEGCNPFGIKRIEAREARGRSTAENAKETQRWGSVQLMPFISERSSLFLNWLSQAGIHENQFRKREDVRFVRVTRGGGRLQVEVIWKRPNPGLLSRRPDGTSE